MREGGNIKPNYRELKFARWSGGQRISISVKLLPRLFVARLCAAHQELAVIALVNSKGAREGGLLMPYKYNTH